MKLWQAFTLCLLAIIAVGAIHVHLKWVPHTGALEGVKAFQSSFWKTAEELSKIEFAIPMILFMAFACSGVLWIMFLLEKVKTGQRAHQILADQSSMVRLIFQVLRDKRRLKDLLGDFREKHKADEAVLQREVSEIAAGGQESSEHQARIKTVHLSAKVYRAIRSFLIDLGVHLDDEDMRYLDEDDSAQKA